MVESHNTVSPLAPCAQTYPKVAPGSYNSNSNPKPSTADIKIFKPSTLLNSSELSKHSVMWAGGVSLSQLYR
jgi:hypothetical protein